MYLLWPLFRSTANNTNTYNYTKPNMLWCTGSCRGVPYKDIYGFSLLFPHNRSAKIGEKSYYGLSISTLKFHLLKQTLCTSGIWGRVCLIQDNVVNLIFSIIHTWQYFALNLRSIPSWAQFLEIGVIINATLFCKIHLKALI